MRVNLKYSHVGNLDPAITSGTWRVFRLNHIADPNFTDGSVKPMGHGLWAAHYTYYTVIKAHYRVKIIEGASSDTYRLCTKVCTDTQRLQLDNFNPDEIRTAEGFQQRLIQWDAPVQARGTKGSVCIRDWIPSSWYDAQRKHTVNSGPAAAVTVFLATGVYAGVAGLDVSACTIQTDITYDVLFDELVPDVVED